MYLPVNPANIGMLFSMCWNATPANILKANMNWSIVVIGAIIFFPGIWWLTNARHVYIKESDLALESGHPVIDGCLQSVEQADNMKDSPSISRQMFS